MAFDPLARAYGRNDNRAEDPTRCAAQVSLGSWDWGQCSRKRTVGLLCGQHAKKGGDHVPQVGSYGRATLARLLKERGPLVEAAERLAKVDRMIASIESALADSSGGTNG